jgi:3-deoxy-D-manno-octulosonic-acid transferase
MIILYNLAIRAYTLLIHLASWFNPKAKLWVAGRKHLFQQIEKDFQEKAPKAPLVWVHCASLGEFEQGRPVIELLKKKRPGCAILLSFFSPSGYSVRKNYDQADYVYYLPTDTPFNAKKWIEIIEPDLAIFVKYEFWYHYLNTLQQKNIPTILVSAIFREKQIFFKWYGGLFRKLLKGFKQVFVQNEASAQLLKKLDLKQIQIAGDTRIDRVLDIAKTAKSYPIIATFTQDHPTMIVGSSWAPDEELLADLLKEDTSQHWKFIFAPHQIKEPAIKGLEKRLNETAIRYSEAETQDLSNARILIIDNIGMLSSIYKYGNIAYIGGGFGAGIHNTLEPIAFGLPVIFGPKYKKFEEACFLVKNGGAFSVKESRELIEVFKHLEDKSHYQQASAKAKAYVDHNQGASKQVVQYINQMLQK